MTSALLSPGDLASFAHDWQANTLLHLPPILPARRFVYPEPVPGEEDALHRGALHLQVHPAGDAPFLATCALGFAEPTLPTGLWSCPHRSYLLAIAGGYGYLIDTLAPEKAIFLPLRPVCSVLPAPSAGLLLLAGFHQVLAIGAEGVRWQTARLSWEGITLGTVVDDTLQGTGWDMFADRDLPFRVDLRTGQHEGGGYRPNRP